jgi:hypothetical protein
VESEENLREEQDYIAKEAKRLQRNKRGNKPGTREKERKSPEEAERKNRGPRKRKGR